MKRLAMLKHLQDDSRGHMKTHPGFLIIVAIIAGFYLFPRYWLILTVALVIYSVFFFGGGHHRRKSRKSYRRHHSHRRRVSSRRRASRDEEIWEVPQQSEVIVQSPTMTGSSAYPERETVYQVSADEEVTFPIRYCPRCGAQVESADLFCLNCGYKLVD